ncbi:MAG TPA: Xaa-Pro peptidase family protein [Bryobacteraceae bacterium]|nr:Xaa-Pro peptidase family protein [Bryobacteraceae bacterium]
MNRTSSALLLLAFALPAFTKMPAEEFRARRAALRKSLDGTLLLMGQTEGRDPVFAFTQEPNFNYLTGWMEPGAALLVTPAREILFLPHHDVAAERYHGRRWSAEDSGVQSATGFEEVLPMEKLESELDQALAAHEHVYTTGVSYTQLRSRYPFREIADAAPLITKLRVKKSAAEIAAIQHATDVSIQAHRAAWKRMTVGEYEYQIAATFMDTFLENGCEGPAYAPIVASGPNGPILHYMTNQRRMDRGEAVVIDAAAECDDYASDITRTIPVGGKFTARQREVYQIVLGAQKAAIAAVKPGMRLSGQGETLTKIAKDYMDAHGKDLHGEPLGKYFTHGIGHQVGLEVHDPNIDGPLEAGMVVTIEPGIYIPEENLGVRIEDVLLVTDKGATVLSAALPKEPDEIEKAVSK